MESNRLFIKGNIINFFGIPVANYKNPILFSAWFFYYSCGISKKK